MRSDRRDFLKKAAAASSMLIAGRAARAFAADDAKPGNPAPGAAKPDAKPAGGGKLKLLILGGTGFLGPQVVEFARKRGHTLTLFNRGKTNPHLFPDLEKLHGDRTKEDALKPLEGRTWDAVVDTSGYFPRAVRIAAERLKGVKQYVFISTLSVYSDFSKSNMDEAGPIGKIADEKEEKVTGESYGPLKALCEQAADKALPGRVTNLRPGLIVGPGDPSDRFTYWPVRVARGGEVLAPGGPKDAIQIIDVRDLAEFVVLCIERQVMGLFNVVGPKDELTMGELLDTCKKFSKSDAKFTWASSEFLGAQNVSPWADMPAWLPSTGETAGFATINSRKAIEKGLTFRPIADTVQATMEWFTSLPKDRQEKLRAGISPQREAEVLAALHKQGEEKKK